MCRIVPQTAVVVDPGSKSGPTIPKADVVTSGKDDNEPGGIGPEFAS
jgi:hypothetical protein